MKKSSQGKFISRFISAVILTSLVLSNVGVNTIMAAPPPPPSSTPTPLPTPDPTNLHQALPKTPSPQDWFSPKIEEARARAAIEAVQQKYLDYYGPRYQADAIQIKLDDTWARGITQWKSGGTKGLDQTFTILAHRQSDGTWQAMMPGSDELYLQWIDAVPTSIVPANEKSQLRVQAVEAEDLLKPQAVPNVPLPIATLPARQEPSGANANLMGPTTTPTINIGSEEGLVTSLPEANTLNAPVFQWPTRGTLGALIFDPPNHYGVDIIHPQGTSLGDEVTVYPVYPGYIQAIWKDYGRTINGVCGTHGGGIYSVIVIYHPDINLYSQYMHMGNEGTNTSYIDPNIKVGDYVETSTRLGKMGNRVYQPCKGESSGPVFHLHFAILTCSTSGSCGTDPTPYYPGYQLKAGSNRTPVGTYVSPGSTPSSCLAPTNLKTNSQETDGVVSPGNTLTFSWSQVSCSGQNGYYIRVGTSAGGSDVLSDYSVQGLQTNYTFGSQWYNRDLYWSVRANASGADWSLSRKFRIEPNPGGGCSSYISNFTFNPASPSNATTVIVNATISTSFPNFRAAHLTVDGGGGYCEQTGLPNFTCNWDTRSTSDGDHTVRVEVDDNQGPSWDAPQTCSSTYHLDPRPAQLPLPPALQSPGDGSTFNEGQSVNLSWSDTGDQYYGEVWGGPGGTLPFDWQSGTSKDLGSQWAGYTYSWHVKARNGAGDSGWSDTRTFIVKLGAPSNLNASVASCTQINLSWNDNSGNEAGYKIYRNGVYVGQVGADVTSYPDSGLSGNTPYSYSVKAFRGSIESNASNTASNTTTSCVVAPSAPTLQSPGDGSPFNEGQEITLCWSASGNEYYGEVWGGPGGTLTFGWQSGTCKNLGSQWAGYTYSWHVKARNTAGDSGWSSTWTFTVKPGTPSSLSAQAVSCDQVNLSWDDNSGNEEGYKIYHDGLYLTTVGADSTSYQNTSLGADTDYSYYVTAYRGSIESDASDTVTAHTPTCLPPDTEKPFANWTAPVTNDETYHVVNQTIQLEVSATDNVGVSWVRFFRWDAVNLQDVEIGNDYTEPYQINLDCAILNYEWNEVLAEAYDAVGNVSDWKSIWLYRDTPQPDLIPYAPSGYHDSVVPSSVPGTHQANELHAGQPTYFDWHFMNNGWATASGSFHVELWVDETRYVRYPYEDFSAGGAGGFDDWTETISTPGWHTVKLIVDPDNTIPESDETNNVWESQFYWKLSAPYSDDMENGSGDWTASGLWHLIDETNPYSTTHSGSYSWWYGQDDTGDYETGSTNSGDLTSPYIYIPDSGYYLRFFYHYQTETQGPDWDRRWIQVSVDGGDFSNILELYDDPQNMWLQSQVIDLSGYAGHTIRVRFNFDTLDAADNGYRGWYIDDFEISTTPPPSCADTHEPNSTVDQATSLVYGQTINADICPGGDYDYYVFTGTAGDNLVVDLDAKTIGSSLDTYAFLLASDGASVLTQNDDDAMTTDSKLGYTLLYSGIYYIKVRAWNHPSAGGANYFYSLKLYIDNADPISASITSPTNDSWLNPTLATVLATASDVDSGIQRVEFLWHDTDWQNPDWVWLGADNYGGDGWSMNFDTSVLAEQQGGAFYIWAFDYTDKWTGAGVGNIGLDRTPPTTTVSTSPPYGGANFLDFYVTWDATDNLAGVAGYDLQSRDGAGGSWTDMVTNTTSTDYRFVGENGHTYYFQSRAHDWAGNVGTYSGTAQSSYTVSICNIDADGWENDGEPALAKPIVVNGTPNLHNFHQTGDQDWMRFSAVSGGHYVIQTANTAGYADTELYLYNSDGTTLLDYSDDAEGLGWASKIEWTALTEGTYYILIKHWDQYAYGCSTEYTVSVQENTLTYTISGNAGVDGVALSYTDGTQKTATSAGDGSYLFSVSYNWSGTVTPSKAGYTFSPVNRPYTNVVANQTGQDYIGTVITYTITGNAGVDGATLSYTDGTQKTVTSAAGGSYSFSVSYNWSGTVTPSKAGYIFTPANRIYTEILSDLTGQNYTAAIAFRIYLPLVFRN